VNVRHILVKTTEVPKDQIATQEAKANDLLKQIRGGADFAAIARQHSDDPGSKEKGGELGWVTRGQMVPPFEQAAFTLKPKEISNIVKTDFGSISSRCSRRKRPL
jgi:peptidyl-prolyl cis-trans isomerase D